MAGAASPLFEPATRTEIEGRILRALEGIGGTLAGAATESTRAVGDVVQAYLSETCAAVLSEWVESYQGTFERRAMADFAFTGRDGNYYIVDVKTHRRGTAFNMLNLTSVRRLAEFYGDDANYFVLLLVSYTVDHEALTIDEVHFRPIESLAWSCLTLGALGWGQIQIANANVIVFSPAVDRVAWMLELCERMATFYEREAVKLEQRARYFAAAASYWREKQDSIP